MPARTAFDVCIVGGGPAGSVAARLLASWGWSVALLHRAPATPPLAESLPPSTRKLFTLVGLTAEIEAAGFVANTGNTARWAGQDRRSVAEASGYHVRRDRLDGLLLDLARRAGAHVIAASVQRVDPDSGRLAATGADGSRLAFAARYVLDCSGRSGVVARLGLRRHPLRYRTLALAAEWRTAGWSPDEFTQTFVESHADGWSWSVPFAPDCRQCTAMIDPQRPRRHDSLRETYARELARASGLSARLRNATQLSSAWACDATVYDCARAAEGCAILVGDAASFIEPLSSAGVKKAVLSAWRAAIVANTCLHDERLAPASFEFHTSREREVLRSSVIRTAAFFREAADAHGSAFWRERIDALDVDADVETPDESTLAGEDVAVTFDRLRSDVSARLDVSPAIEFEPAPTIEGNRIVMRDALRLPGLARPIRFASNVNLPALLDVVAHHHDVKSSLLAYQSEVNRVPPADVLRGLSLLVARRAILHEGIRP